MLRYMFYSTFYQSDFFSLSTLIYIVHFRCSRWFLWLSSLWLVLAGFWSIGVMVLHVMLIRNGRILLPIRFGNVMSKGCKEFVVAWFGGENSRIYTVAVLCFLLVLYCCYAGFLLHCFISMRRNLFLSALVSGLTHLTNVVSWMFQHKYSKVKTKIVHLSLPHFKM